MKLTALLLLFTTMAFAQTPEVPAKMQFAGMTLTIRDDARREIQKDVDALTQSPKHHNIKVERAKTYFPIIEKIFEEERVPDDFKFLVLQESALIADAVSVSNAVGFWQFKDFTAVEMGLRVDKEIDERMNIVSATRGAARYIKKNNYYFNNWIYALQAYQMGAGGTMKAVKDYQSGTKHMEITSQTYWYVKKFLAHKVAFESYVKGAGEVKVYVITNRSKRSLKDVAEEFLIEEEQLKSYNKWVRKDHIPDDKSYMLSIPTIGESKVSAAAIARAEAKNPTDQPTRLDAKPAVASLNVTMMLHGLLAIKAVAGETPAALAKRANVDISSFLRYNDISISDKINANEFYYLKKKKTKGSVSHHVVIAGDNLWSISQQYGVQLKKLERYNKLKRTSALKEGSIIYLTNKRAVTEETLTEEPVEVESGDTFNWTVQPKANPLPDVPPTVVAPQQPVIIQQPVPVTDSVKTDTVALTQHVVVAGETLYSIAKRYQVGVMELVEWNNLSLSVGIKPGQVLKLKAFEEKIVSQPTTKEVIHTVKASDTLYSIAREYGVTIKELMDWNQKKDFSLTVGEKLKIVKNQ